MSDHKHFLWNEINRPRTVKDLILPESLKSVFQGIVDSGDIPPLLMVGRGGVGKTSAAVAMCEELGCDYLIKNGSLEGNIDTLRNDLLNFASSVSFSGGRKQIILDEADYLNPNSFQPALRNFAETYSNNCGFILTCNYINRIIEPLWSRGSIIDFKIPKDAYPALMQQFYLRVTAFLEAEGVEFEGSAIAAVIKKYYPDCRRVWNELQRYAKTGKIDSGILTDISEESFKKLVLSLKKKDFNSVRKWVAESAEKDSTSVFRRLYDVASQVMTPDSVPQLVIHLAKYQDMATRATDMEILMTACMTEVMCDCSFKD